MTSPFPDTPCCVCLALCHEVVEDARTRNKSLFSLFSAIAAQQVPTMYTRLAILASVAGATPGTAVRILVRTPSGQELFRADGKTEAADTQAVTDFPIELNGIVLPEYGAYAIELYAADVPLARRFFSVTPAPPAAASA